MLWLSWVTWLWPRGGCWCVATCWWAIGIMWWILPLTSQNNSCHMYKCQNRTDGWGGNRVHFSSCFSQRVSSCIALHSLVPTLSRSLIFHQTTLVNVKYKWVLHKSIRLIHCLDLNICGQISSLPNKFLMENVKTGEISEASESNYFLPHTWVMGQELYQFTFQDFS